jgi:hypothetical protein
LSDRVSGLGYVYSGNGMVMPMRGMMLRGSLPVCFSVEAVWLGLAWFGLVVEIPFLLMFVYDCRIPCCSRILYGWGVLVLRIKELSTSRVTCWRSELDTSVSRP